MRNIWGQRLVGNIRQGTNKVALFGRDCYAIGADKVNQVSKIQGAGLSYCYGDEVTTWSEPVFQMLKSRLDKPGACFDGTCNPDSPRHWFKVFLDSGSDVYQMPFVIDDNTFLEPSFVRNLKGEYAGTVYYDRFILGRWSLAEGRIYDMFNREKHTVEEPPGQCSMYYVSMDYGTLNPTAMLLWGKCNGTWYLLNEYYHSGRTSKQQKTDEEYYEELVKLAGDLPIRAVIIDPSAASMSTTIRAHGRFVVIPADNAVVDGIRTTAKALNAGQIKICRCCTHTIEEAECYVWDDKSTEDKPLKVNDHAMDAMRYFVMVVIGRLAAPKTVYLGG